MSVMSGSLSVRTMPAVGREVAEFVEHAERSAHAG